MPLASPSLHEERGADLEGVQQCVFRYMPAARTLLRRLSETRMMRPSFAEAPAQS